MSSWRLEAAAALVLACAAAGSAFAQTAYPGIGRPATPREVAAWDIDVRPDFQGLPRGAGSVARGQEVWEDKCASCHGIFGESNQVFSPLVGGTTAEDVKTGRVANLARNDYPGRTTLMKVPTVSTLWDYIHRAMPWNQPKSLSADDVFAVTAYMLHLGGVLPAEFTLSDRNIAEVQQRMPNRNGMSTRHGLWPGKEFGGTGPDTRNTACMKDCAVEPKVASLIPEHARDSHGNLRDQNRLVGPQRGAVTVRMAAAPAAAAAVASTEARDAATLLQKNSCTACHGMDSRLVGPSFADIAKKHGGQHDYLAGKILAGGVGVWGSIPMPPQPISETEARAIAAWLAKGAPR